jgi:hypothetical protein
MPSLADLQGRVARAVMTGDIEPVAAALVGGSDPRTRLAIHRRHYHTSLTAALLGKFPATAWLAGAGFVAGAARAYVEARPPRRPCIAEYGADFPQFLAIHGRAATLPYLQSFAELERAVAEVSIAIALPSAAWAEIASLGMERLLDLRLAMQPGLRYLSAAWRVDELMRLYLDAAEPETFVLPKADTFVEVRGARGALRMTRLDPAVFAFRKALHAGQSIAVAAEAALACDLAFDAGAALRQLAQSELVTRSAGASQGVGP